MIENTYMNQKIGSIINEGVTFYKQDKHQLAIDKYKKAIKKSDRTVSKKLIGIAHHYVGLSQFQLSQYEESIKSYLKAIEISDDVTHKYDLSLSYLFVNDYENGFKYYKYRYYRDTFDAPKFPKIPMEFIEDDIERIKDKRVLVLREQGIGDELMFSRVIEKLSTDVKFARVQVMPTLLDLFVNTYSHLSNIEFFTDMQLPFSIVNEFDCYVPFGNLFSLYMQQEIIPQNKLIAKPKDILTVDRNKINVAICLGGNKASGNYHKRNIDHKLFKEFIDEQFKDSDKEVVLYNIQISEDVDYAINIKDMVKDMNDTANILQQMDYVYSTDTAVLYLAKLLGLDATMLYRDFIWWVWRTDNMFKNNKMIKF
jgi:tetratricopeptide (TPR) repeat protein